MVKISRFDEFLNIFSQSATTNEDDLKYRPVFFGIMVVFLQTRYKLCDVVLEIES
jgi:hypothetical protein